MTTSNETDVKYPWEGQDISVLSARHDEIMEKCGHKAKNAEYEELLEVGALLVAMRKTAGPPRAKKESSTSASPAKRKKFDARAIEDLELPDFD